MNDVFNSLINDGVQCWTCPIFDKMFQIVSEAAAAAYPKFIFICIILFCVIFAFYIFNTVWTETSGGFKQSWLENKSLKKVIINSIVALSFLVFGVTVPRFVTRITFEPVADITLSYTQALLYSNSENVHITDNYTPIQLDEDKGMFRPQLRDSIINIAKTTISQFQSFLRLGIAIIDASIDWKALFGIANFIKHLTLFLAGIYLFFGFLKLFIRFLFYFADIIIAMMFFAFFFPISLVMISFKDSDKDMPEWAKWTSKLGSTVGTDQIKNVVNSIVTLGSVVITYTVILVFIALFFKESGTDITTMISQIQNAEDFDISLDNLYSINLVSFIVLLYVANFIAENIPQVTTMILSVFNMKPEKNKMGEKLADDVLRLTKDAFDLGKKTIKTVADGIKGK